jgi:demethylmenaquinone methyltransferase/2-methoxy-6-polyprenyl-1,4-benzoquinol methylase
MEQTPEKDSYKGPNPEKIRRMFGEISERYDLANTVLSAGIHHLWRRKLVRWSGAKPGDKVLDCATGTGDLAIEFKYVVENGDVFGTDFCKEMLVPAPVKAAKAGVRISFSQADVMNLPFNDEHFDVASIAFGIRNVADPKKGLSELGRVVRPGGTVMVLEFGQPRSAVIAGAYNFYSRRVLPKIGGWVTGNPQAYEYLQNSSAEFPCREAFAEMMRSTGRFENVQWRSLSMGIAYMYKATVTALSCP